DGGDPVLGLGIGHRGPPAPHRHRLRGDGRLALRLLLPPRQRPSRPRLPRGRDRPAHPRHPVRTPGGAHRGDVPGLAAVQRGLARLPARVDHRRRAGSVDLVLALRAVPHVDGGRRVPLAERDREPPRAARAARTLREGGALRSAVFAAATAAVVASGLGFLFAFAQSPSPDPAYVLKDHYEKREVMIPMRDGERLFAAIYSPWDTSKPYPFLVTRDAYGVAPYGADKYRPWAGAYLDFSKEGFIFVYEDVRGRWRSEGEFVHHDPFVRGSTKPSSSTDMYDTVEWLLANVPNHNGRVSQRG